MTPRAAAACRLTFLIGLLCAVTACDQLGNPPLRHGRTPPVTWTRGGTVLTTSSQTFPSERATEVLRGLPRHQLQQVEPNTRAGSAVLLVAVEIASPRRALPYAIRFVTVITAPDGARVERLWQATGHEQTYYAAFAVDRPPAHVVTRLR